jgi:hypothetical protein
MNYSCRTIVFSAISIALSTFNPLSFSAGLSDASTEEAQFLSDNDTIMTKMMDGMSIKPSGDVDQDFVGMMVPHHRGAIEMAQAELRYGHNEQLRRIAQEIIIEQQQEIIAMRLALGQPLPLSAPAPDQQTAPGSAPAAVKPMSHNSMPMNRQREP